jgi:hypothetical protein
VDPVSALPSDSGGAVGDRDALLDELTQLPVHRAGPRAATLVGPANQVHAHGPADFDPPVGAALRRGV